MAVHITIHQGGIYFVTFTCFKWLALIEVTAGYDLVYKWFDILSEGNNPIVGYVIMPNHVHLMVQYTNTTQPLNTILGNGKRFLAYELVKRLTTLGE